jgi:hypothetical protein
MRNLSFGPKALVIVALFLVSLSVLAFSYYSVQLANVAFSAKERVGVRYLQAAYPVLDAAIALRRDATAMAAGATNTSHDESRRKLDSALQALQAVQAEIGAELNLAEAFAAYATAALDAVMAVGSASRHGGAANIAAAAPGLAVLAPAFPYRQLAEKPIRLQDGRVYFPPPRHARCVGFFAARHNVPHRKHGCHSRADCARVHGRQRPVFCFGHAPSPVARSFFSAFALSSDSNAAPQVGSSW